MRRQLSFAACPLAKRCKMYTPNENIPVINKPSPDDIVILSPRTYQTELVEQAKQENLVICLPTGSGKTYIAVMLIKDMSNATRESLGKGGKRTIFLVKTVQLVEQQSTYIRNHTDLHVGVYYGEMGVDYWREDRWSNEFEDHQVLVFTAQVFLDILDHNYFSLKHVNLIIFDECHHATGDNQYASLMNKHYDYCPDPPRVLGLTASISSRKIKPKNLVDDAKALEKTYRARIASRDESIQHGTSAQVETIPCRSYRDEIVKNTESLTIPFDFLRFMINKIQTYLSQRKDEHNRLQHDLSHTMLTTDYRGDNITAYHDKSSDYTTFIQSQSPDLVNLKRYLENLVDVGNELGLLGLRISAKELRKKLKLRQTSLSILDISARDMFDDIFQRLECLVDDILKTLYDYNIDNCDILFSPKVLQLLDRILSQHETKNAFGKCIVFVERVHTATILSQVLSDLASTLEPPRNTQLKVKHVTGTKAIFNDKPMTAKHQSETIREFRIGKINVLIATAVVEEGLDIPVCDLVIRFNKPNNFSSYMQSKGRARAKQHASYVLFMDESDGDAYQRDRAEYENYEEIEKMIQRGFSSEENDDDLQDELAKIPPYRPSEGVVIDATRAAQLIMQYCVLLGNGQIFPPRFLFHGVTSPYKCILSMPANCPIRDDITCEGKTKKLAKYECCLKMVIELHQKGEFNEHCLPNRNRTLLKIPDPIENRIFKLTDELLGKKTDSSFEIFSKQISTFPVKSDTVSTTWHLYQINNELGFVTPCESLNLPKFNLYRRDHIIPINITYLKSIDYKQYQNQLENFCKYLFEEVFDDMNTNTILQFDLEQSTFKLLLCLLRDSTGIDWDRMTMICNRKNKCVENYSELNDKELYSPFHLPDGKIYMNISDESELKRASDRWNFKKQADVETYEDYFKMKVPNVHIRCDRYLATMKGIKKPRINYLKKTSQTTEDDLIELEKRYIHYPIEFLHYAPLNQHDMELVFELPSILVRLSQLYRIERLRKSLAENISSYSLLNAKQMPPVTFDDCLKNNTDISLLPLIPLTYSNLTSNQSSSQPSPGILLQAITRRSADENMDMENLEILGDCFLKLTVSMSLYHRHPLAGAGALTVEKAKQISNGNLYRIAVLKKLKTYLNAMKIDFRGKQANWIPPGYIIDETQQVPDGNDLGLKRYKNQRVKRKAFADMIEALMGAFLVSTDYSTTLQFMKSLGLDVIPVNEKNEIMEVPPILCSYIENEQSTRIVQIFYEQQNYVFVENIIGYQFNNKAYLIAAFTHPSSFANRLTNCYERLEFLGDAVLDFLVTRHIFVNNKEITPGRVTDIRQDLSNNGRLAYILVKYRLHTKILHNSPDLFGKISVYTRDEELFPKNSSDDSVLSKDTDQWADSTAPKALADVFEALVGAIFLDSGKCLKTVWQVIEPLLQEYIVQSITNPNLNPVRRFFENGGEVIAESTETDVENEKTVSVCTIKAKNGSEYIGYGDNKRVAKADACRRAMKDIPVNQIPNVSL